jgi:excisionase family DNA binding protein
MTSKQVAELLLCSEKHIERLRRAGELVCIRVGRLVRFEREDVERYILTQKAGA